MNARWLMLSKVGARHSMTFWSTSWLLRAAPPGRAAPEGRADRRRPSTIPAAATGAPAARPAAALRRGGARRRHDEQHHAERERAVGVHPHPPDRDEPPRDRAAPPPPSSDEREADQADHERALGPEAARRPRRRRSPRRQAHDQPSAGRRRVQPRPARMRRRGPGDEPHGVQTPELLGGGVEDATRASSARPTAPRRP